jgi:hypothetical protein
MNRIRAAYFERVPEVQRYFVMPGTDDRESTWRAMGTDIGFPMPLVLLASAPALVGVLNAVIAGAIGALAAIQLGAETGLSLLVAVIVFLLLFVAQTAFGRREALRERPEFAPMFPTETPEEPA